jgi:hypothetical protein
VICGTQAEWDAAGVEKPQEGEDMTAALMKQAPRVLASKAVHNARRASRRVYKQARLVRDLAEDEAHESTRQAAEERLQNLKDIAKKALSKANTKRQIALADGCRRVPEVVPGASEDQE